MFADAPERHFAGESDLRQFRWYHGMLLNIIVLFRVFFLDKSLNFVFIGSLSAKDAVKRLQHEQAGAYLVRTGR